MPERPHPERRLTEHLLPAAKLVIARDSIRQEAEYWDNERKQKGATDDWIKNLESSVVDVFNTDVDYVEVLGSTIKSQIAAIKPIAWRRGLFYSQGVVPDFYFLNFDPTVNQRYFSEKIELPESPKSFPEVDEAQRLVGSFAFSIVNKSEQNIGRYLEREGRSEFNIFVDFEEIMTRQGASVNKRAKRGNSLNVLLERVEVLGEYETKNAEGEALDWVLGEEDENNGLAKMLVEQRENPPRS